MFIIIWYWGHIQTICEKNNVIMTLTPHPPPPPPLASYVTITFMKVERLQSFTLLRDSTPTTQSHFFYSPVQYLDIARSAMGDSTSMPSRKSASTNLFLPQECNLPQAPKTSSATTTASLGMQLGSRKCQDPCTWTGNEQASRLGDRPKR